MTPVSPSTTQLVKRMAVGPFVDGIATVTLDGEPIGDIARERKWYTCTVLGEHWGGGRNVSNALRTMAVAYRILAARRLLLPSEV